MSTVGAPKILMEAAISSGIPESTKVTKVKHTWVPIALSMVTMSKYAFMGGEDDREGNTLPRVLKRFKAMQGTDRLWPTHSDMDCRRRHRHRLYKPDRPEGFPVDQTTGT